MASARFEESQLGRGNRDGARLFRDWFGELSQAAEAGRPAAYVFVMGSLGELLRTFDLPLVFPEINSLQTAVRRSAHELLNEAEDYGYSPDICGYVKADVATQLRGGVLPMGRIPKPSIAIATNACNTYIKWAEIWERMYDIPVFTLDVPGGRSDAPPPPPGSREFQNDRDYVAAQLHELIPLLERVSGVRFDIDRLRENLAHANSMNRDWSRVLSLNRSRPAPFNALSDGTIYLGVANALRGTAQGAAYFAELVEEMEYKAEAKIGTLTDEKYRLLFVGVPCYPIFRRFTELFTDLGGLADGLLVGLRDAMASMFFNTTPLLDMAHHYQADGVVFHPIKSCRTVSTGLADSRRALMQREDIPCLFIESDMMDRRVVSEAQLKNRIDAFFEGLATRRRPAALVSG
jgi:benzoyl-CoA reductase subunit B